METTLFVEKKNNFEVQLEGNFTCNVKTANWFQSEIRFMVILGAVITSCICTFGHAVNELYLEMFPLLSTVQKHVEQNEQFS